MALLSNNNTIPAELQEQIAKEATDYANALTFNSAWINPIRLDELKVTAAEDWKAGATEYAIWKVKYGELKAENERLSAEHADLNLALAAMLNGYQNLSMHEKDWFTVPIDLIDQYTKMVLDYDSQENSHEKESEV